MARHVVQGQVFDPDVFPCLRGSDWSAAPAGRRADTSTRTFTRFTRLERFTGVHH
jgi:hypothetical protein